MALCFWPRKVARFADVHQSVFLKAIFEIFYRSRFSYVIPSISANFTNTLYAFPMYDQSARSSEPGGDTLAISGSAMPGSNELFQALQQAPVGIAVFRGSQLIAESANAPYLNIIGKSAESFLQRPLFDSLPEIRSLIEPILQDVLASGNPFKANEFPVSLNRNGGTDTGYFNFVYQPVRNPAGVIDGFLVIATEVTDSVLARHRLKESEAQFRKMIMDSPIPMTIFHGPRHIVEFANRQMFEKLWRLKPEQVLGKPIDEVFPELHDQKYMQLLDKVYYEGIPHTESESPAIVNGGDGIQYFYLDYEYAPLKDPEGKVYGIMATVNDVSDKVNARETIRRSEHQFKTLVETAPVLIWMSGADGKFDYFNAAFRKFTGKSSEHFALVDWQDEVFPDDIPQLQQYLKEATEKRTPFQMEFRLKDKEAAYRWIHARCEPNRQSDISGLIFAATDVHEQVLFKQQVKEEEARRNLMLEASGLGTWELDLISGKVNYSPRFIQIFRLSENRSYTHREMIERIHPDDLEIRRQALRNAMEHGHLIYKIRVVSDDGAIHWVEARGKLIENEHRDPIKLLGTVRDVTDAHNYEHKLRESEQQFRMLADTIPQFVWTADAKGVFTYFNKEVCDQTGLNAETLLQNEVWLSRIHPEDRPIYTQLWEQALSRGTEFIAEHRFQIRTGQYRWMLSRGIPQKDTNGNVYLWSGTSTDIQDQKAFEQELKRQVQERTAELHTLNEALRKSEARYHLMVNEIEEYAIIYINVKGIIENWNKGAEKIKGYTAEEIIGQNFALFYTDQDRAKGLPENLLKQASILGKVQHEGMRLRKDGTLFWANVLITAIYDTKGRVIGFSKVTHDLTQRKQADDQIRLQSELLHQKNNELEKINAELQSFAYISSHDLQEPLRKIQIFAGRVMEKEQANLSAKGRDYFERMQVAAARMQKLIQDLLLYSRTNHIEDAFDNCDLSSIVRDIIRDLSDTIGERDISFEIADLPTIHAIPFQMTQLFHNLLGNSVKFMRREIPGKVMVRYQILEGRILSFLHPTEQYVHISVIDNGIGFQPEFSERIFEVFQRVHETEHFSGTGIGLAIVKKIVDNHNGFIRASGKPNEGAHFEIYLPTKSTH